MKSYKLQHQLENVTLPLQNEITITDLFTKSNWNVLKVFIKFYYANKRLKLKLLQTFKMEKSAKTRTKITPLFMSYSCILRSEFPSTRAQARRVCTSFVQWRPTSVSDLVLRENCDRISHLDTARSKVETIGTYCAYQLQVKICKHTYVHMCRYEINKAFYYITT